MPGTMADERPAALAGDDAAYTITEAARLAQVSVQALRQRVQRGTVATTRLVREHRVVVGISHDELVRAYPDLAGSRPDEIERALRGEAPPEREQLQRVEVRARELGSELERLRAANAQLRQRLAQEREERVRLEGVAQDRERRLAEAAAQRERLAVRVAELDNRLVFLDGGTDDAPPAPPWWRSGVAWVRLAVGAVVLLTAFAAGGAFWDRLDRSLQSNLDAGLRKLESDVEALREELPRAADVRAAEVAPGGE